MVHQLFSLRHWRAGGDRHGLLRQRPGGADSDCGEHLCAFVDSEKRMRMAKECAGLEANVLTIADAGTCADLIEGICAAWARERPRWSWRILSWRSNKIKPAFKALVSLKAGFNKRRKDARSKAKGVPRLKYSKDKALTTSYYLALLQTPILETGLNL